MIVTCSHCGGKLDVSHLAEHPDMVTLVMKGMGARKKGRRLNISEEDREARSERMRTLNLNRAALARVEKLPRPKKK